DCHPPCQEALSRGFGRCLGSKWSVEMDVVERDAVRAIGPAGGEARRPARPGPRPPQSPRAHAPRLPRPHFRPCRACTTAPLIALSVGAVTTLVVPIAVRRMIDFGFSRESANLIDSYFAVMIAIVAVLALASASRFFLVTTLGERIVADLREGVFGHLVSLSLAYFDEAKSGELVSRLTADTTQIKAAVGASVSIALRNSVLFAGAAAIMV